MTTTFFGGRVLTIGSGAPMVWIAITAFCGVGLSCLSVLWPRHAWEFSAGAIDVLTDYVEPSSVALALIHRDLALHRGASYLSNERRLRRILSALQLGVWLLVVEVIAWVAALAEVV